MNASLNPANLRNQIQSTLNALGLYSVDAEELLMATCANESNLGEYRVQIHGPAMGIFQMEPEDFNDIYANWLKYHTDLQTRVEALNNGQQGTVDDLINNDPYAIAMCRCHYLRAPGHCPPANNIEAIWAYYKQFYNTPQGGATRDQFMLKYNKFVFSKA